jgi:hypothetical protein
MILVSIDTTSEIAKGDVVASCFRKVFRLHSDFKISPGVTQKSELVEAFRSQALQVWNWG